MCQRLSQTGAYQYLRPERSLVEETQEDFPIVLIGGKVDLEKERQVSKKEGLEMCKSRKLKDFIECSSKTGRNVEVIFDTITRLMLGRFE